VAQKGNERAIIVTILGFTYIYALDYMLSFIEFSTKAFTFPEESLPVRKSSTRLIRRLSKKALSACEMILPTAPEGVVSEIQIELEKIEVIMLESLEVPDAIACVFNCFSKMQIRVDPTTITINGQVSKIVMGVANYWMYLDSGKFNERIMSPTNVDINGLVKGMRLIYFKLT